VTRHIRSGRIRPGKRGLRTRSLGRRGAGVGRSSGEWSGERAEHEAGFFLIRDSVDHVAGRLDVTRYTIYHYLGEIRGRPSDTACALTAILSHGCGVVVEQPQ